eukprot:Trichotokara_eunicae@DN6218_c0_g1_i8.p1
MVGKNKRLTVARMSTSEHVKTIELTDLKSGKWIFEYEKEYEERANWYRNVVTASHKMFSKLRSLKTTDEDAVYSKTDIASLYEGTVNKINMFTFLNDYVNEDTARYIINDFIKDTPLLANWFVTFEEQEPRFERDGPKVRVFKDSKGMVVRFMMSRAYPQYHE